ncbi:retrotransposon-like protein 1 [Entomophthora muscae]|uniref:Retrotransposon-like protein 1 n=1 Tax=Entomophthora muscae TaxID=34485 RepID=A0ACC2TE98_9FUNG|nr:retrotransposon-like protein 1 [Entomophthora muscae]
MTPNPPGMSSNKLQCHYQDGLCFYFHEAGHLPRAFPKKNTPPVSLAQINTSAQSYKFIQVTIDRAGIKRQVKAFIDTGADESFIDTNQAKELGLKSSERSLQVTMGNSSLDTDVREPTLIGRLASVWELAV